MSFEHMLRDHLQRDADAVPLPIRDPDQAADRARQLRRRRTTSRAAAAGLVVAIAAAIAVPTTLRDSSDDLSVADAGQWGLVPTGPLDLDWQQAPGGLSYVRAGFVDDAGTVYALSTGPGARAEDHPDGDTPQALYRLADDGTWEPVLLDGDRPRAIDMASGGGLLHAVSTGPASGGDGTAARLSTSADGGQTWSSQEVDPIDPPSTVVPWSQESSMAVESNGSTTLALVTTSFYPDTESLFPELGNGDDELMVETREQGLVLVRYTGPVNAEGAATDPPGATTPDEATGVERTGSQELEEVRTVPWAELGVDGMEALDVRTQVFRRTGEAWEPVEAGGLPSLGAPDLQVAGDRFVATGWAPAGEQPLVLTSTDGASWAPVSVPGNGQVVSVGPALVLIPHQGTVLKVSGDGGATWDDVDLAEAGLAPDSLLLAGDGGPLGLALVVQRPGSDRPSDLVVSGDLIDWTVTPLSELLGGSEVGHALTTVVGEDRIVVSAAEPLDTAEVPASVTAVGTPVRTP